MTEAPANSPDPRYEIIEVRVGRPVVLGATRRGDVTSAIAKRPLDPTVSHVELGEINLDGDDQADRSVHGGPDKSVYCYPSEHAPAWARDGFDLLPGSVGENLVLAGVDESAARIGDVWEWGGALVQISSRARRASSSPCTPGGVTSRRR